MDYTASLFWLESVLSGPGGAMLIAVIGAVGILGAHVLRMKFRRMPV